MKKPTFRRQNRMLKRLSKGWRSPKGGQSKLRRHEKSKGFMPQPGYRTPSAVRGLHPSGLQEVLISNIGQLKALDPAKQAGRIAGTVGGLKRAGLQQSAAQLKIKIVNQKKIASKK